MSVFLPQFDPNPRPREEQLADRRRRFEFNYSAVSPLAVIERVPVEHEFSLNWMKVVGEKVLNSYANRLELEGDTLFAHILRAKHGFLGKILTVGTELFLGSLRELVGDALKLTGRATATTRRPTDLKDYADLFRTIGLPPIASDIHNDRFFALQRLAGPNPVVIRRLSGVDERFPVDEAIFQSVVPGDSLFAAGAEGRLFLTDYRMLDGAELGVALDGSQKYLYAPLALFVVDRNTRELLPVAIQCGQKPGPDNPIFTPLDGWNWLIAKTTVEIADGNLHEAVSHLGLTHLLIEPFVISTYRQLASRHPLFTLLAPHFEGTLAINDAAWRHLIANKGAVDKLLAGTIKASRSLVVSGLQSCRFNDVLLPRSLAARGVDSDEWLKVYPYRDDAQQYWAAIQKWVADYLALYYPTDADVTADRELNAWLAEIASENGGRIAGLGPSGPPTLDYLIDVVTTVIFTCSTQHAAVNFPQYEVMSYLPAMPLAGYSKAPTTKTGATREDYLNHLPPMDMAELQMELGYMLGSVYYTKLGDYPDGYFADPQVAEPLARFQTAIKRIGESIGSRNESTGVNYATLTPNGIPQSINI
jgi:arachidonate 15-lipoxygenase